MVEWKMWLGGNITRRQTADVSILNTGLVG